MDHTKLFPLRSYKLLASKLHLHGLKCDKVLLYCELIHTLAITEEFHGKSNLQNFRSSQHSIWSSQRWESPSGNSVI